MARSSIPNDLRDLDIGLGTPVIFSRSDHQGVHKVWGTQLDETLVPKSWERQCDDAIS
jgi:hypothetical protein